jgi:hypothetical protein
MAAAESESPLTDMKQSSSQKEAITAQMIGIISSRLDALQTLANNRKLGLESDLKVNADYCSKMVPGLQDPYESRAGANSRAKTASSTTLASNQAMMERLFGPDDKSRLRTVRLDPVFGDFSIATTDIMEIRCLASAQEEQGRATEKREPTQHARPLGETAAGEHRRSHHAHGRQLRLRYLSSLHGRRRWPSCWQFTAIHSADSFQRQTIAAPHG